MIAGWRSRADVINFELGGGGEFRTFGAVGHCFTLMWIESGMSSRLWGLRRGLDLSHHLIDSSEVYLFWGGKTSRTDCFSKTTVQELTIKY